MKSATCVLAALALSTQAYAATLIVDDGRVIKRIERPHKARASKGPAVQPVTTAKASVIPPSIDPQSPLSQPPYPDASRLSDEEGNVVVGVYVLANGTVGRSWVEQTSGFHRLDEAAVGEAQRWRFLPAVRDGIPIAATRNVVIRFALRE